MKKIELLAPAGTADMGVSAVNFGADAVYVGGPAFGARKNAGNSIKDIERLVKYAHGYGARVYAALNTLIYEDELKLAEETARRLIGAGVDALIIQDMALLRMDLPPVELHASTQVCNRDPEKIRFLGEVGFTRVVLERGLTLRQIEDISAATSVELEAFVHGAVCVGYSGQCYLSRSMSHRSGNRGDCMQACRLSYDLVDGSGNILSRHKHMLSVKDMDYSPRLQELISAGITSFKIEGRLKDEKYLRNITSFYRKKIDEIILRDPCLSRSSSGVTKVDFVPDPSATFTRSSGTWVLDGKRAGLADIVTPKSTGKPIGEVVKTAGDGFILDSPVSLAAGDGICFTTRDGLVGTRVDKISGRTIIPARMAGITPGTIIFRNRDQRFITALENSRTRRAVKVRALIQIMPDIIELTLADEEGIGSVATISGLFPVARDQQRAESNLRTQIGKSGNTPFDIIGIEIRTTGAGLPHVPASALNALRREALQSLWDSRSQRKRVHTGRKENLSAAYPYPHEGGALNITNSLSRRFYREHGVQEVQQGYDLHDNLDGVTVLTTPYCIRREAGLCLKENKNAPGRLFLDHGTYRYRIECNCRECVMKLINTKR